MVNTNTTLQGSPGSDAAKPKDEAAKPDPKVEQANKAQSKKADEVKKKALSEITVVVPEGRTINKVGEGNPVTITQHAKGRFERIWGVDIEEYKE